MENKNNKSDYIKKVYLDIAALLQEYEVKPAKTEEDEAFQEDLFVLFLDRMKGSYKNGIQVGLKRKANLSSQNSRQDG